MKKLFGNSREAIQYNGVSEIEPRGISHTVSYATSFDETWNHIRIELKKLSVPAEQVY